ncbi:lipid-A-disaccharide synthase [Roseibium sp. CAU 1637]|uniref:Lipid-A-disaccharide synthase n=1 Tax=Roseibium limicola TaxID=2816037 RepID=A0A939EMF8_9HYPH|nr:lipid-A-disaccharide synthase [Roseibium limicola]MBO0344521.1 lipid-A-disaccharide synthase [Roseibium limicola]
MSASVKVGLVVGEESGDFLGSALMASLKDTLGDRVAFCGTGGQGMQSQGLTSVFDIGDTSVMGITAVLQRLPLIIKRVHQTVDALVAENPDVVVIIDSPDFTHNVAKRLRKKAAHIPIIGYVSPSVWVWRPGRARKMTAYVDELLALLPFEPAVHKRLGGPRTHYVGHPLIERLDALRPGEGERSSLQEPHRVLVVLPGSRGSEIERLLPVFGEAVAKLGARHADLEVLLPAVSHLRERIAEGTKDWAVQPLILDGEAAKHKAFRRAHAALAASGTVTLQLAISGVPMAVAYKVDWFFRRLKDLNRIFPIVQATSMVLPNIILGRNVIPEYLDEQVTADALAQRVEGLLSDTAERRDQIATFQALDDIMKLPDGQHQSQAAARVVLDVLHRQGKL